MPRNSRVLVAQRRRRRRSGGGRASRRSRVQPAKERRCLRRQRGICNMARVMNFFSRSRQAPSPRFNLRAGIDSGGFGAIVCRLCHRMPSLATRGRGISDDSDVRYRIIPTCVAFMPPPPSVGWVSGECHHISLSPFRRAPIQPSKSRRS